MVQCVGYKRGKVLLKESEPNVRLVFGGADAHRFKQVDVPRGKDVKDVIWTLTLKDVDDMYPGFWLPALID